MDVVCADESSEHHTYICAHKIKLSFMYYMILHDTAEMVVCQVVNATPGWGGERRRYYCTDVETLKRESAGASSPQELSKAMQSQVTRETIRKASTPESAK